MLNTFLLYWGKKMTDFCKLATKLDRNVMEHLGPELVSALAQTFCNLFTVVPSDRILFCPFNICRSEQILFWQASQLLETVLDLWAIAHICVCGECVTLRKQNKIQPLKILCLFILELLNQSTLSRWVAMKFVCQDHWWKDALNFIT